MYYGNKRRYYSCYKKIATNVTCIVGIDWWRFSYNQYQMIYITDTSKDLIRICIPHYDTLRNYDYGLLISAINDINREVKYVKVFVLRNGSISINYDHKYNEEQNVDAIILHILRILCFAAESLKCKLAKSN